MSVNIKIIGLFLLSNVFIIGNTLACTTGKYQAHSYECTLFYVCANGDWQVKNCPFGLHFNSDQNTCDWPENANCIQMGSTNQGTQSTTPPYLNNNETTTVLITSTPIHNMTTIPPNNNETTTTTTHNTDTTTTPTNYNETTTIPPDNNGTTTIPIQTGPPIQHRSCPTQNPPFEVFLPHPNCSMYYICLNGDALERNCPPGLHWNKEINICDWPANANCEYNAVPSQPPPSVTTTPINNGTTTTAGPPIQHDYCPPENPGYDVLLPHPNCSMFYKCEHGEAYEKECPPGLLWNNNLRICDWPENANCEDNAVPTQPTPAATTTTPINNGTTTTAGPPIQHEYCPAQNPPYEVFLPHPNCSMYYICLNGDALERNCPPGLHWNKEMNICDWPANANCEYNAVPSQPPPSGTTTPINNGTTTTAGPPIHHDYCPPEDPGYDVLLPHPNCSMFYKCEHGEAHEKECPPGLLWNNNLRICDWPENANCENNAVPSQPPPSTTTTPINNGTTTTAGPPIHHDYCPPENPGYDVLLPHPNCSMFYKCEHGEAHEKECPPGLLWNNNLRICDWPENANCEDNAVPSQPPPSTTTTPINNGTTTTAGPPIQHDYCPAQDPPNYTVHLPHPNCEMFYKCEHGEPVERFCSPGLHWCIACDWCDLPEVANCIPGQAPPQPLVMY